MTRQRKKSTAQVALPVMRPDAAGIDVGATEVYAAVPVDRDRRTGRCSRLSRKIFMRWLTGWSAAGLRPWLWNRLRCIGFRCFRFWRHVVWSLSGQCAARKECAGTQDRRLGLSVAAVPACGRTTAGFLSARAGDMRCTRAVAAPGESGADDRYSRSSHAKGAGPDESSAPSRDQRYHRCDRPGDYRGRAGRRTRSESTGKAAPSWRIKASEDTITKSLVGDYRSEHLFTLRQSLTAYRSYQKLIGDCDNEIHRSLEELDSKGDSPPLTPVTGENESPEKPPFQLSEQLKRSSVLSISQRFRVSEHSTSRFSWRDRRRSKQIPQRLGIRFLVGSVSGQRYQRRRSIADGHA